MALTAFPMGKGIERPTSPRFRARKSLSRTLGPLLEPCRPLDDTRNAGADKAAPLPRDLSQKEERKRCWIPFPDPAQPTHDFHHTYYVRGPCRGDEANSAKAASSHSFPPSAFPRQASIPDQTIPAAAPMAVFRWGIRWLPNPSLPKQPSSLMSGKGLLLWCPPVDFRSRDAGWSMIE
ncbi:hypothetical protein LZ31DRAFT_55436 [Colletotrichum somersetense]|nr:hypothetical protein LZ31DRAFT_55436 [Colletotrichum somersetense]